VGSSRRASTCSGEGRGCRGPGGCCAPASEVS
jgi:hypothetical protein